MKFNPYGEHDSIILRNILKKNNRNLNNCERCGKEISGCHRHVHHKDKDRKNNQSTNLLVCCVFCHKREHGLGKYSDYAIAHGIPRQKAWRILNREKYRQLDREWKRKYYLKNKEKMRKRWRISRLKYKARINTYNKKHYSANRKQVLESCRAYRALHRAEIKIRNKKYYDKNRIAILRQKREKTKAGRQHEQEANHCEI